MATSGGDPRSTAQRAKWVYSRAGSSLGARRRGEKLNAKAALVDAARNGTGDSGAPKVTTPSAVKRFMAGGQDGTDKAVRATALVVGGGLVLLLVGRGLILGAAAYLLWWALVPWVGRIRIWVWAVLGVVVALVSYVTWYHTGNQPVTLGEFVMGHWWRGQYFVAAVFAAWLTYAYGWLGVTDNKVDDYGNTPTPRSAVTDYVIPKPAENGSSAQPVSDPGNDEDGAQNAVDDSTDETPAQPDDEQTDDLWVEADDFPDDVPDEADWTDFEDEIEASEASQREGEQ